MKCHILFSGKNKKNIINLSSAENAQRVVKVNIPHVDNLFSYYDQPNNYLTNSSLLPLITLNSAFKTISYLH